jgi:hypothetical protein
MLGMGTGGGEVRSRLPARAQRTVATEAFEGADGVTIELGQKLGRA